MTFTFEMLLGSTTTRNRVHLPYCTSLSFLLSLTAFSFTFLYVYIIYVVFFFLPLFSSLSSSGVACIYYISLFFFFCLFFLLLFTVRKSIAVLLLCRSRVAAVRNCFSFKIYFFLLMENRRELSPFFPFFLFSFPSWCICFLD